METKKQLREELTGARATTIALQLKLSNAERNLSIAKRNLTHAKSANAWNLSASADFWKLVQLLCPGHLGEADRGAVLSKLREEQEREKFDKLKQAEKVDYLFEKAQAK